MSGAATGEGGRDSDMLVGTERLQSRPGKSCGGWCWVMRVQGKLEVHWEGPLNKA